MLPAAVMEPPPPEYGFGEMYGIGAGTGAGVVVVGAGFVPRTGAGTTGVMYGDPAVTEGAPHAVQGVHEAQGLQSDMINCSD